MNVVVRTAAVLDVAEARDWYDGRRVGLGMEFVAAFEQALLAIADHPMRFRVVLRDVRQALVRRFPYRVLYRIQGDRLVVIACFHASRDPRRWQRRD